MMPQWLMSVVSEQPSSTSAASQFKSTRLAWAVGLRRLGRTVVTRQLIISRSLRAAETAANTQLCTNCV